MRVYWFDITIYRSEYTLECRVGDIVFYMRPIHA